MVSIVLYRCNTVPVGPVDAIENIRYKPIHISRNNMTNKSLQTIFPDLSH